MKHHPIPEGMPFSYIVEDLAALSPVVGRMFGCYSIYIGEKIVLVVRDRESAPADNGVWIATSAQHHESLSQDLATMRSIELFGPGPTGWQVLPVDSDDFEQDVEKVCKMILRGDERVGKIPAKKKKSKTKIAAAKKVTTAKKEIKLKSNIKSKKTSKKQVKSAYRRKAK